MRVRVITLRENGRRTRRADASEGISGDLQVAATMHGTELYRVARLCARRDLSAQDVDLLSPLYSPELVAIGTESMLLRGYEASNGVGQVQEWHVTVAPRPEVEPR
jgi:hypothetical protein